MNSTETIKIPECPSCKSIHIVRIMLFDKSYTQCQECLKRWDEMKHSYGQFSLKGRGSDDNC